MRWNNLYRGLAVGRSKRTYELTSSIVPRGTSVHRVVELKLPSMAFDPERSSRCSSFSGPSKLSAINPETMHNHGQPSSKATTALFIPRCLAIFIAQALSQDHFAERSSMTWAAS